MMNALSMKDLAKRKRLYAAGGAGRRGGQEEEEGGGSSRRERGRGRRKGDAPAKGQFYCGMRD